MIEFLGFVIGKGFIKIDLKKVKLVASWLEPAPLNYLQAFFEFANFYWQFIKNYSQRALGMTKLLKKKRLSSGMKRPKHLLRRSRELLGIEKFFTTSGKALEQS